MPDLTDKTNVRLPLVVLAALVSAVVTVTAAGYKMREDTLRGVGEMVKAAIDEQRAERTEILKHYVTREEWLKESFELRELILKK